MVFNYLVSEPFSQVIIFPICLMFFFKAIMVHNTKFFLALYIHLSLNDTAKNLTLGFFIDSQPL